MGYKEGSLGAALEAKRKTPLDDIVTDEALGHCIGCCVETIRSYTQQCELPFMKIGKDYYFSLKSVLDWFISRQRVKKGSGEIVPFPGNGNGSKPQKKQGLTKGSKGLEKVKI